LNTKEIEKTVAKGIEFLGEFLPLKTYLYFPLLSSVLIWAIRRTAEWKERILSFEVWLDPDIVENKPDAFILDFFESRPKLGKSYAGEIQNGDMNVLRPAFKSLYPIVGLEDPFLQALFRPELEAGEFRTIARSFKEKTAKAKEDIDALEDKSRLIAGLKTLAEELLSLNIHLLSEPQVQKVIIREVKRWQEKRIG
jgi:hypothetical protein